MPRSAPFHEGNSKKRPLCCACLLLQKKHPKMIQRAPKNRSLEGPSGLWEGCPLFGVIILVTWVDLGRIFGRFSIIFCSDRASRRKATDPHETLALSTESRVGPPSNRPKIKPKSIWERLDRRHAFFQAFWFDSGSIRARFFFLNHFDFSTFLHIFLRNLEISKCFHIFLEILK